MGLVPLVLFRRGFGSILVVRIVLDALDGARGTSGASLLEAAPPSPPPQGK